MLKRSLSKTETQNPSQILSQNPEGPTKPSLPLRRDYSKYFKMLAQAALTLAASWLSLGQVVLQQHGSDENCPPCYGSNRKITAAPTDSPVHLEEVVVWRETEQDHQSIKIKQLKTCHQYYSAITTVNIMMALWSKSASIFLQRGWNPGVSRKLLVESTSNSYWTTWSWRRFGSKVPSPKFDVPSIFFSPWITFWMQEVPEIILHAAVSDCQAPFNVSSIKKLDDIL